MESLFCLNHHISYLEKIEGLSASDIAQFLDKPFRQAVDYVHILDSHEKWSPKDKMDCVEKMSRSIVAEIDDYYAKSEVEREKAVIYQNRYKRFKKLET